MIISGEFSIKAQREVVFETIRDPKSFISLVDGLTNLEEIDATHYKAVLETKIAYLKFKFNVSVEGKQVVLIRAASNSGQPQTGQGWLIAPCAGRWVCRPGARSSRDCRA